MDMLMTLIAVSISRGFGVCVCGGEIALSEDQQPEIFGLPHKREILKLFFKTLFLCLGLTTTYFVLLVSIF